MILKRCLLAAALSLIAVTGELQADSIPDRDTLRLLLGGTGTIEDFEAIDVGTVLMQAFVVVHPQRQGDQV